MVFIHKFIVFHMLDRCIRWEAAQVIPDKSAPTLMKAIDTTWITIHGPPKELICDLETGIVGSDQTTEFLARKGISSIREEKTSTQPTQRDGEPSFVTSFTE